MPEVEREKFETFLNDRKNHGLGERVATHQIFADWLEENGYDDEATLHRKFTPKYQKAEDFMYDLAEKAGGTCVSGYGTSRYNRETREVEQGQEIWEPITYEMLIKAGHDFVDHGEYFVQIGSETLRNLMYQDDIAERYWESWAILTGRNKYKKLGKGRSHSHDSNPFSCSC